MKWEQVGLQDVTNGRMASNSLLERSPPYDPHNTFHITYISHTFCIYTDLDPPKLFHGHTRSRHIQTHRIRMKTRTIYNYCLSATHTTPESPETPFYHTTSALNALVKSIGL